MKYELTARRLREAMEKKGMRQKDLSEATGISKGNISHYYNGNHTPDNVMAMKIAKALDVEPDWIMGIDEAAEYTLLEKTELTDCIAKMTSDQKDRLLLYAKKLLEDES